MVLKQIRKILFLFTLAALGECLAGCHKEKPTPSLDAVSAALEHAAEQTLTAPSLSNEQVILPAKPGQIETLAGDVIHAASAAGGAALQSLNAQGQVSILATIPDNNADAFKAALRNEKIPLQPPSTTTRLIEVLIENPASPSPTP